MKQLKIVRIADGKQAKLDENDIGDFVWNLIDHMSMVHGPNKFVKKVTESRISHEDMCKDFMHIFSFVVNDDPKPFK